MDFRNELFEIEISDLKQELRDVLIRKTELDDEEVRKAHYKEYITLYDEEIRLGLLISGMKKQIY